MPENPLLQPWTAPFGVPPFDLIRPEHFPAAFDQAMAAHKAEVAAIATDPAPPGFGNTVAALEQAGRLLGRVAACFFNLVSSLSSDALQAVERDYAPRLARHRAEVTLDPAIFARIATLHAQCAGLALAPDEQRLLPAGYPRWAHRGWPNGAKQYHAITWNLSPLCSLIFTGFVSGAAPPKTVPGGRYSASRPSYGS